MQFLYYTCVCVSVHPGSEGWLWLLFIPGLSHLTVHRSMRVWGVLDVCMPTTHTLPSGSRLHVRAIEQMIHMIRERLLVP